MKNNGEIMRDFLVLNFIKNDDFNRILEEVVKRFKLNIIEECQDYSQVKLVFSDIEHIESITDINPHIIIGVTKNSAEIDDFYKRNIFHAIPINISSKQLESLIDLHIALESVDLLKYTFKKNHTYSFDDFIYYADHVFMHSSMGIAFLTSSRNFLLFNKKFSTFFHNIYNEYPIIRKQINLKLNTNHQKMWDKIVSEGSDYLGESLEVNGKWDDANKHYNMQITPIFKLAHLIGYSIIIEDISQFANANADLKRYYKYLLEQNTRLEKAYKEVELNNEKLKIAYEKVNALSNRDYLTQAPNRKYFLEKIEYEQLRYKRTATPFILAYGDIDDFKIINDTYGHETGDYILISLTNLIKNTIRNIDFFCRWGGEEFLIFLAESDLKIGKVIVERILKEIRNFEFNYNSRIISITMTFGLAVYERDQHINQIIDLADKKLYWGKKNNKNQVVDVIPNE